jgi:hypothetical protein
MAQAPFVIQPDLTGIAIAYKNEAYIADMIAPRQPVNAKLFEVDFIETDTMYRFQDDKVGRMSAPNQIVWQSSRTPYSTEDHALDSPVPNEDIENYQGVGPSPEAIATELVSEGVALNREKRVCDIVQNPNSYTVANRTTLSGSSQWTDSTSNPVDAILAALDIPIVRPNYLILSQYGWRVLRQHPRVVESVKSTGAGAALAAGVVARQAVAELLELSAVVVGESRGKALPQNIGATASIPARLWGKHAALITVDPLARMTLTNRPTFIMTGQHGDKIAGTIQDPDMGMRGGVRVRSGEDVKEVIISKECAYFFENAFA